MKDKTHAFVTVTDTNAAKESKQLIGIISEVKNVATALEHFIEKHAWVLSVGSVEDLEIMVSSLECIYMGELTKEGGIIGLWISYVTILPRWLQLCALLDILQMTWTCTQCISVFWFCQRRICLKICLKS